MSKQRTRLHELFRNDGSVITYLWLAPDQAAAVKTDNPHVNVSLAPFDAPQDAEEFCENCGSTGGPCCVCGHADRKVAVPA